MSKKIAVLDFCGPGYNYDSSQGFKGKSPNDTLLAKFDEVVFTSQNESEQLQKEFDLVKSGELGVYVTNGFFEIINYLKEKDIIPVLASSGTEELMYLILEKIVDQYSKQTGNQFKVEDFFKEKQIVSTEGYSKKNPLTWKYEVRNKRFSNHTTVAVFEDSINNLIAGMNGLSCEFGYNVFGIDIPEGFTKKGDIYVPRDSTIKEIIIAGSMTQLKPVLKYAITN